MLLIDSKLSVKIRDPAVLFVHEDFDVVSLRSQYVSERIAIDQVELFPRIA